MIMRSFNNLVSKINLQKLIVSLCIFAVCIGTQQIQTVAWNTGIIEFARDSIGVLMAVIIFTNYKWNDFLKYKIPYLIWGILGAVLGMVFVPSVIEQRWDFLMADTIIISLGIYLMGFCIIHTVISLFWEKSRPSLYVPLFVVWVVMLTLMIFSRSSYTWPECYFVLFLTYYLTPQSLKQKSNTIEGIVNGIILAFIVIQAHSLLFRPYDRLRYYGNFCNPNHNGMFLCVCLAAIMAKILYLVGRDSGKFIKAFYFLLLGVCYSFLCMTMCRSGYLAAFVATIFFLIAYSRIKKKRIFIRMGILLVSLFIVLLPFTYLAVRYIPTIHPHVLFYFQEGYSVERVHSWDERDSEKYTSFERMLEGAFGRIKYLRQSLQNLYGKGMEEISSELLLVASESGYIPAEGLLCMLDGEEGANPDKIPALSEEEAVNEYIVRYTIFNWYFTHLTLRGMPYEEQGFQLTEDHWIQDTHNIYLDYGINFGYPVMVLFAVFIWWGIGRLVKHGISERSVEKFACLFIALIPPVFGLFEFSWGAGMISTVGFYMVFKEMVNT